MRRHLFINLLSLLGVLVLFAGHATADQTSAAFTTEIAEYHTPSYVLTDIRVEIGAQQISEPPAFQQIQIGAGRGPASMDSTDPNLDGIDGAFGNVPDVNPSHVTNGPAMNFATLSPLQPVPVEAIDGDRMPTSESKQ